MKNTQSGVLLISFILLTTLFSSCSMSCTCDKYLGCKIISAKQKSNDSLLEAKVYCSQTNYYTDRVLQDSVKAFNMRHDLQGKTTIIERDSMYHHERYNTKRAKENRAFLNDGFDCQCAK